MAPFEQQSDPPDPPPTPASAQDAGGTTPSPLSGSADHGSQPSRIDAERFIQALTGDRTTPVTFQTFPDNKEQSSSQPAILHGTLAEQWDQLVNLNRRGHGVFVMVNEGDGMGRKKENVVGLRALFIDDDRGQVQFAEDGAAPFPLLAPTLTVQSKHGQHNYFGLGPGQPVEDFTDAQEALARHFGTDPAVKDLPRVMRVAGFLHMKDPSDPFLVRVVQSRAERYTLAQVLMAYPPPVEAEVPPPTASDTQLAKESIVERAARYLAKVPHAVEGDHGDEHTFKVCAKIARGFDLADDVAMPLLLEWNKTCQPPWSEVDLLKKLQNARQYGTEDVGSMLKPESTSDLLYVIPRESYVFKLPDGEWDLDQPIGKDAAGKFLQSLGMSRKQAKRIVDQSALELVHGVDCCPGKPAVFERNHRKYLNSYVPPTITPTPGDFTSILKILRLLTADDEEAMVYIIQWCALKVQNPGARNLTALVFNGDHGTGKGTFEAAMRAIIGEKNCACISQRDLGGSFNGHYVQNLLVCADEVVSRDNILDTSSDLKQYLTDPWVSLNIKNVKQHKIPNRMSWIFSSNSPTPVRVEGKTDRRYSVFASEGAPSAEHKAMLSALYKTDNSFTEAFAREVAAFAHFLLNTKVDATKVTRPYENDARAELAKASRSSTEAFLDGIDDLGIQDMLDRSLPSEISVEGRWWWCSGGARVDAVYMAYRRFCEANGYRPSNESNFGKEVHQRRPKISRDRPTDAAGKRVYVYTGFPHSPADPAASGRRNRRSA